MKTLLLIFSIDLNHNFHLINTNLSDNDFIIEFIKCEIKDIPEILEKAKIFYYHNHDYEDEEFGYIRLDEISINEVLKFQDGKRLYLYNDKNFDENHDFIRYICDYDIAPCRRIEILKEFMESNYERYIEEHPIESVNCLKLHYKNDEVGISELINEKFHELSFKESISKIIDSKIDKLRSELLEVIESKFKEIETRINKYF